LVYNVYTCAIGQLRATVQAPVSGNESRVAGWGRPVVSQRRSEMTAGAVGVGGLALWSGHPARRCRPSSVVRASGHQRSIPSSECIFHLHYVSPSVPTQNGRRAGGVGGGQPTLSRLAVPIKDVSE